MDVKELITCDSRRGKIGMLVALFLLSIAFALVFEAIVLARFLPDLG